ncbi:uncharacterized protein LOC141802637 [Halichoeres trimaculatus]|uniref:uncharacterized protein LOC141802637 n=1 Tax=Halichoeres trimaculatus TaxID=147232 RepID=UPI003D9DEEFD
MASGFGVRVLLLSLLVFGGRAEGLSYRSGGSHRGDPHFDLAEDFPNHYKPESSSHGGSGPHGSPLSSFSPSFPEGGFSHSMKPQGGQGDGYRPGGVPSSKPDPLDLLRRRKNQEAQIYQTSPNTDGVLQTKAGMWDFPPLPDGYRFEPSVISSEGTEEPAGPEVGPQKPRYPSKPQQQSYVGQPQQPSYVGQPQQPSYVGQPQQPSYVGQPQQQSYVGQPQQPSYVGQPQQPQQPSSKTDGVQSKANMWDFLPSPGGYRFEPSVISGEDVDEPAGSAMGNQKHSFPSKPQQPGHAVKLQQRVSYLFKPQQPSFSSKPQQPSYNAKPQQQSNYAPKPQQPSYNAKPQQPSFNAKPQQPSFNAKPQQPSYSSKPQQPSFSSKPQQPSYNAKPQQPSYNAKPQQPSYSSKPQQPSYNAKPQQPSYSSKLQQPSYNAKPQQPSYNAKPQQPSYNAKPQQPSWQSPQTGFTPGGVLQTKAGMWDLPLYPDAVSPRSSAPIPMSSLDHPRWRRPVASAHSGNRRP